MTEGLNEKRCTEFVELLASTAPVPGGGGAAALVGAVGSALCEMAGNLTIGRKKYANVEQDVRRMVEECAAVRTDLMQLVEEDAKAFEPLSKAYSIPKGDPTREQTLELATLEACKVPLQIMEQCCRAVELLEEMLEKGSAMLVSDVGCGAICCGAALESASLNVFINTKTLCDREQAAALNQKTQGMLDEYLPRARQVARQVLCRLRPGEMSEC